LFAGLAKVPFAPKAIGEAADIYGGMAKDLRAFADEQEIAAFKVAHGNEAVSKSNAVVKKTTDELTDAEKKRLKALKALMDEISGAKAQAGMDLLAEAVAKVGLEGVKNFDTLREKIEKFREAGATVPPMLEAIRQGAQIDIPKALHLTELQSSLGEVKTHTVDLMDGFTGLAGMTVFEDIARSAREIGIPLKEIPNVLKTAGASAQQVKVIMGALKAETFDWGKALQTISQQFQNIGSMAGGVLGDILNGFANIATQIAGIGSTLDQFGKGMGAMAGLKNIGSSFGEGLGGIVKGLTGALPVIGGVMSIGKTIFGGIKSLFGGKSKEEKAAEESRKKAWEDLSSTLEDQHGTLGQLQDQAAKYGVDLSKAMDTKDAEAMNKELKELEKRQKGLKDAASGISKVIENIKPTTEAGAMAQAGLFSTVFWATVQREGLVAASDALRGAFDTLMEGASESMQAFLGPIATQMNLAANEAFASAAEGAAGLAEAVKGMSDAGILSIQDMTNAGQVAMDAYNQALHAAHEEGLMGAQAQEAAIRAVGPAVAQIKAAYEAAGIPIDANTAALIAQAEASGMAFATDPMSRAANAMEQVAIALGKAFGFAVDLGGAFGGVAGQANRAAQAAGRIPTSVPSFPGTTGAPPTEFTSAAKGMSPKVLGRDTIIQAHKGEGVMVVPKQDMGGGMEFASAQGGFGGSIGHTPGPSGSTGAVRMPGPGERSIINRPTVVVQDQSVIKTPEGVRAFQKETIKGIYKALDQNAEGLARRVEYQQRSRCRSRI
jgi:hypothetical protein